MNKNVETIVDLLFMDVEDSPEVEATRDEIMTNCQEHFDDLVAHGMTEDEAVEAIAESLSGMEEVLAQYPKKGGKLVKAEPEEEPEPEVPETELYIEVGGWDVEIRPAADGEFHMETVCGEDCDASTLTTVRQNGVIRVKENLPAPKQPDIKFDWSDPEHVFNSFGDLLKEVGGYVRDAVKITVNGMNKKGGIIRLAVPASVRKISYRSASGDLDLAEMDLDKINITTASGDSEIKNTAAGAIEVRTTSGDHKTIADVRNGVLIHSTSGDVSFFGTATEISVATVSGDVSVSVKEGDPDEIRVTTVSGDVEVNSRLAHPKEIRVNTTSGDSRVLTPNDGTGIHAETRTVSGDVSNDRADAGADAPVTVKMVSVSGDIRLM